MNQAQVEQVGTPAEMYDRPASRFAASFIGHSNLLNGRIPGSVAMAGLDWFGQSLPLPPGSVPTGAATLMVRPENARLVPVGTGALSGTVQAVVFQGSDLKVIVDIGQGETFTVRTSCHGARPEMGESVAVAWDSNHSVLLTR